MLNHIVIMGRLTKDPELRTTQSGVSVTSFTLAVDRDFKNKDSGEKSTDFIDVVAWRQTAEFVCKYFSKGRMAVAEGRLQIVPLPRGGGGQRLLRRQQAGQRRLRLRQPAPLRYARRLLRRGRLQRPRRLRASRRRRERRVFRYG